jgi:hypothetical protein
MAVFTYPSLTTSATLPTGASTEAKQDSQITELQAINTDMDTLVAVDYATQTTLAALNAKVTAVDTGSVTISASLPAGTNNIGDVDIASALPSGSNTIGNVNVNAITPQDFLDSGVVDASSTNIPAAGLSVVASLAANVTELEIIDDIGDYMTLTDGADVVLAYLPLGGGRVKVSISSGTALKLASVSGSTIVSGKIAINFLG